MGLMRKRGAFAALAFMLPATASAQDSTQFLPPIDVWASRTGTGIAGASNSVITAQDIARSPGTTIQDVLSREAGVQIGFGTDLLGETHVHQSREFAIRARVLPSAEILRSATAVNARLLRREGELGVIAPGARADLLLVDGDPLADLSLLDGQGERIPLVMKGGEIAIGRLD